MNQEENVPTKAPKLKRSKKVNDLDEQLTVYEKDGSLLVRTSEEFNTSPVNKQNLIVSTVIDILLKSNKSDTLFTVGLSEDSDITMKVFETFSVLSLESREQILKKLSMMMRKLAETKGSEKQANSEYLH